MNITKDFILYILASTYVVTSVLIQEDDDYDEHVIYYISKTLTRLTINFVHYEKLSLAVVLFIQWLHHCILLHKTKVIEKMNPM